ncbi:MAG TPA: putative toxin-antitoxin system toxin component, PIN family [Ramlibacter sp.]|uniref:putative toxin-antitoxin system toxin component, PIN family n=1 Tax=Ramlibacter sp. TaxID=1917967 RepID=UPI002D803F8B|nr:putative toxin-antitoxin system toxin component, PIN family [Ramlibacter sp.]HET8744226.1 putative toxin-antitoxin system toxin component, PIN family [Ramlibacter sp.]
MQLVLDTNIVLDLLVFDDPQVQPLFERLRAGELRWLATAAMREELARVLRYPQLAGRVSAQRGSEEAVLADFDRHARLVEPPGPASVSCRDPDDQKFIDLAVAHRCTLLSKDREVLRLRKHLQKLDVEACARWAS